MPKLTDKQELFCQEYLIDMNGTQAAIRAGYSTKSAKVTASRLLTNTNVITFLSQLKEKAAKEINLSVQRVLQEYVGKALTNIGHICDWDSQGNVIVKDSSELNDLQMAAIQEISMTETVLQHGKKEGDPDVISRRLKVKLRNNDRALEVLGKYTKLFDTDTDNEVPPMLVVPPKATHEEWEREAEQQLKRSMTIEHDTMKQLGERE